MKNRNKRNGLGIVIVTIILILLVILTCIFILVGGNKKSATVESSYNARIVGQEEDNEEESIYKKSDKEVEYENDRYVEEIEEYLGEHTATKDNNRNRMAAIIVRAIENGNAQNYLNEKKLEEKGYAFNSNWLDEIEKKYQKETGTKDYRIVPYDYIEFKNFWYCRVKVLPVKIYENGEAGFQYDKFFTDTYTIYNDGLFLPYPVDNLRDSMTGIHKITNE